MAGRAHRMFAAALVGAVLCTSVLLPLSANAAISNWQKGVNVFPFSTTDYSSSGFKQVVDHMQSLGVNYITLIIPYFQSNDGSTDLHPGWNTPTDDSLVAGIQYMHSKGMHVMLTIHMETDQGDWRANINPSDRTTWFSNYNSMLMHYAQIAQQQGVEEYCIGSELINMSTYTSNPDNTSEWQKMIANVRGAYSGLVTYSANWDGSYFADEVDHIGFWSALDSIGISAYYNLQGDGSVSSLESDWDGVRTSAIEPLEQKWNKPILFTEIGYRSVTGAHNTPWDSGLSGAYDPQEQVNDYTALFAYWNNYSYMTGVHLWNVTANPNAGGSGDTTFTPQNKPAEQTMSQYFNNPPAPNGGSGGTGGGTSAPAIQASGSVSNGSPAAGQSVGLTANVSDSGGALSGAVIDLEVYGSGGGKVFQQFFSGENIPGGGSTSVSANWTPSSADTYTLKVGVFSGDWSHLYVWNNAVATITVGSGGGGGGSIPPPSGSAVIDNWWPVDGAKVSGNQPFKALVEGMNPSQYKMYWRTGANGQLNLMADSSDAAPHKEVLVDLSGWHWLGNPGPYPITFVATDLSGNVIATKSLNIYIY